MTITHNAQCTHSLSFMYPIFLLYLTKTLSIHMFHSILFLELGMVWIPLSLRGADF